MPAPTERGIDSGFLAAVIDAQPDAIVIVDRERRICHYNAVAVAMSGLDIEASIGLRITELRAPYGVFSEPGTVAVLDLLVEEVMTSGRPLQDDDTSRVSANGEVIPIALSIRPVYTGGVVVGAVLTARNEGAVGSLMFRMASVGMAHIDRLGNVREANDSLLSLVARSSSEVRTKPFLDLVADEDRLVAERVVTGALHGDSPVGRVEVRVLGGDGAIRWVDLSVAANGLGGGKGGGACAVLQDITERVLLQAELLEAQRRLRNLALHDPLTGLPNRTQLADRLVEAQDRAATDGGRTAVLFIDLDGFKQVNDSAGHQAGDRLLVEVSDRLRALLRPGDTAARIGGDEFVVCCVGLGPDEPGARQAADLIADRVKDALSRPFTIGEWSWQLGASVGIAVSPAGGGRPDDLLRWADAEMYRAKGIR